MSRFRNMSFWEKKIFFLFGIFMLVQSAAGQNLVSLSLSVPQYNQIYAADLDIQHTRTSSILFTATLQSMAQTQIQVKFSIAVIVTLAGESPFQLADATTQPFTLNPGQVKVITNVDLSGANPSIPLEDYNFDEEQFNRIKNITLATGKVPAGTYEFDTRCIDVTNSPISSPAIGEIIVSNPSRVDLILPANGENVTTVFPHFQWSANVDTVVVSVYEKLPDQQSAEDVVSGVPYLQTSIPGTLSPSPNSFNYPPSGAGVRPLENGKTYYWFVDVPPSSTRGSGLRSQIWSFTVASSDTTLPGNLNQDALQALKNFLDGTPYENLLSRIGTPTGDAAFDGTHITIQDLINLLQNTDKSKIINATIQ